MKRRFTAIYLSLLLAIVTSVPLKTYCAEPFQAKPWLEDFTQLKQMMAEDYPNLESQVQTYHLNLPVLSQATEKQLKEAKFDNDAVAILKKFAASFKDAHLQIQIPKKPKEKKSEEPHELNRFISGALACKIMSDWNPAKISFPFPTSAPLGFSHLETQTQSFPYGILTVRKHKVGFIRIPSFVPAQYPELCADEWDRFRNTLKASCDNSCQEQFFEREMQNRLLREFESALKKLELLKITALLLDLTDNGGGKDWVAAVTRIVTKHKILCGQFGFIKHSHWTLELENQKKDLGRQIAQSKNIRETNKLRKDLTQVQSDLAQSKERCDRAGVWDTASFQPNCDLIVKRQLDSCEPTDDFHYSKGLFGGPLFVLTNRKSASASEDIVGRLKDSKAAFIIGERTAGAGCGFTEGGIDLKLKHSGLIVRIPDCARYLRNGVNEVEGIAPDVEMDMSQLTHAEFVLKLKAILEKRLRP